MAARDGEWHRRRGCRGRNARCRRQPSQPRRGAPAQDGRRLRTGQDGGQRHAGTCPDGDERRAIRAVHAHGSAGNTENGSSRRRMEARCGGGRQNSAFSCATEPRPAPCACSAAMATPQRPRSGWRSCDHVRRRPCRRPSRIRSCPGARRRSANGISRRQIAPRGGSQCELRRLGGDGAARLAGSLGAGRSAFTTRAAQAL